MGIPLWMGWYALILLIPSFVENVKTTVFEPSASRTEPMEWMESKSSSWTVPDFGYFLLSTMDPGPSAFCALVDEMTASISSVREAIKSVNDRSVHLPFRDADLL